MGGGAWGTALAQTLRLAGREVLLWAHEASTVEQINNHHRNPEFLRGIYLDGNIRATEVLAEVAACDAVLMVAPAQHVRTVATALRPHIKKGQPVVNCAKGIEKATGRLMGQVLAESVPEATLGVLSGPSFAADVARGLPAALTIACANEKVGRKLAEGMSYRHFRLYWSRDLTGVELGGAVKNVLAIAAGIVSGSGLGASAHAAIVTRGFAELRRLGEALGARPETLMGLSGLGDLILTAGSAQSRNMSLGYSLGQGEKLEQILKGRKDVTEGVYTAVAVMRLAAEHGVEMPIAGAVRDIVEGRLTVQDAIKHLQQRPLKAED